MSLAHTSASPPPAAGPVYGGDNRLREAADLLHERGDGALRRPRLVAAAEVLGAGHRAEAAEVEPGAKAPAGAGQHDDPAGQVSRQGAQMLVELGDQRLGQRVQLVRPRQRQLHHARPRLGPLDKIISTLSHRAWSLLAAAAAGRMSLCCPSRCWHKCSDPGILPVWQAAREDATTADRRARLASTRQP